MEQTNMPVAAATPASGLKSLQVLVQDTWNRFVKRWKFYVLYTVVSVIVPGVVFMVGGAIAAALGLGGMFAGGGDGLGLVAVVAGIVLLVAYIAAIYVSILFSVGLMLSVMDESITSIKDGVMRAKPKALSALLISIIVGIIVTVGMFLLIIPGIYFAVCYAFALWVFLAENKTGMEALKGSKDLVSGRWMAVFGRLLGMGVVFWLVTVIPMALFTALRIAALGFIWQMAVSVVAGPLFAIFLHMLYQNLKEAKMKGAQTVA